MIAAPGCRVASSETSCQREAHPGIDPLQTSRLAYPDTRRRRNACRDPLCSHRKKDPPCSPSSPRPAGTPRARERPPRLGPEMAASGLEGPVLIIAGKTVIGLLAADLAAEPGGGRAEARGPPLRRRMLAGGDRAGQGRRPRAEGADDRRRGGRQGARHGPRGRRRPGPARGQLPHRGLQRRPLQRPVGHLHRGRRVPGVPLLPQEPRPGAGRYRR